MKLELVDSSTRGQDLEKDVSGQVVDCPTQLTLVTWICQLCFTTNTSEKYERTQQGNLLEYAGCVRVCQSMPEYARVLRGGTAK